MVTDKLTHEPSIHRNTHCACVPRVNHSQSGLTCETILRCIHGNMSNIKCVIIMSGSIA